MKNIDVYNTLFGLYVRLYDSSSHNECFDDFKKINQYIEKLEKENFGLRQQVTNLKEKDEKRWL